MRRLPCSKLLAAAIAVLAAGAPASAHVGDHSHLSFAELGSHLASRPDHALAFAAALLALGAAGVAAAMRRKARAHAGAVRFPETPAT